MKLNISQEMLDKLKRLKGKIALFTAATATVIGLAGCTNTDAITLPSDAPITSEMPSSEVPSSSEEMSSEEVSEELPSEELPSEELPSEDVVVEDVYSAESIIKYVDELAVKYPNENPEHIKATLIMASLDKISEEDRVALFDAYGFTYETLESTMLDFFDSLYTSHSNTTSYYQGAEQLEAVADFETRIPITEFVLADEDKEFAENTYKYSVDLATGASDSFIYGQYYNEELAKGNYSFADDVVSNYYYCSGGGISGYISVYETFGVELENVK